MTAAPRAKHAEDFIFGETLGHGSFGDEVKAQDKESGQEYAIKIIEKALVVHLNKQKYVVTERDILSACNHPNIVRLYYTFRSETSLRLSHFFPHSFFRPLLFFLSCFLCGARTLWLFCELEFVFYRMLINADTCF